MLLSTWFAWIVHMVCMRSPHHSKHLYLCFSPYGSDAFLHMFEIMSPYASLHTLYIALSTYWISCLRMLLSTWFSWNCPHGSHAFSTSFKTSLLMLFSIWFICDPPHGSNHVSICFPPYAVHRTVHILNIMSPHVVLHMVSMQFPTCIKTCLHMLLSTWLALFSPHVCYQSCTCFSPHGWIACVHMSLTIYRAQG